MKKRMLAILMSLVMLVGLMPVTAMADEPTTITSLDELKTAVTNGGNYVVMGSIEVNEQLDVTTNLTLGGSGTIVRGYGAPGASQSDLFHVKEAGTLTLQDSLTLQGKTEAGKEIKDQSIGWLICLDSGLTGSVTIKDNVTLKDNRGSNGGALRVKGGTLNINGGTFSGNLAYWVNNEVNAGIGGVMYASAGTVNITAGTFEKNTSTGHGGAVYADGSVELLNISGGLFSNNHAKGSYGGAIHAAGVNVNLLGGTITDNKCLDHGGGISFLDNNKGKTLLIGGDLAVYENTNQDSSNNLYIAHGTGTVQVGKSLKTDKKINVYYANDFEITAASGYTIEESDVSKLEYRNKVSGNNPVYALVLQEGKIKRVEAAVITFNANSGEGSETDTQEVPKNIATALDANSFSREGYVFTGWNTAADGSGTKYADGAAVTLDANTTLYAQWAANGGYCGNPTVNNGEDVRWSFDSETGTLTISGTGETIAYKADTYGNVPWAAFKDQIKTVVFENGITKIGDFLCYEHTSLKNISISPTVRKIENNAFQRCTALEELDFSGATGLLGDVNYIGFDGSSFIECSGLKSVIIPEGVGQLGGFIFSKAGAENSVLKLPSSLEMVGKETFSHSRFTNAVVLPNLKNLGTPWGGADTFNNAAFAAVVILNEDITFDDKAQVGHSAFRNYSGIVYVSKNEYATPDPSGTAATGKSVVPGGSAVGVYASTNGGTFDKETEFTRTTLAVPVKEGYAFAGWYDNVNFTGTAVTTPEAGRSYYAKWTDCGITFDGNGVEGTMDKQFAAIGDNLTTNTYTRDGYAFKGWTLDQNGSGTVYADGAQITEALRGDVTLYAKWAKVIASDSYFVESATTNKVYTGEVITLDTTDVVVYKNDAKITEGYTVDATSGSDTGTYTVAVKVGDVEIGTVTCKITPATLTARYVSEVIRVGRTPALFVEVTGFVNGETADTAAGYTAPAVTTDKTEIGTYTLKPSGGAADNYTFAYESGTLTIKGRSGGSSSSSSSSSASAKNEVSTDTSANGSIELNTDEAKKGDTVTFTVKPEEGYEVGEVTVTDENGKEIKVTDNGDGTYSFTMPDSEVEIEATFEEVKEEAPAKEGVAQESISLTIGSTVATVDGMPVVNDVAPIIRGERTMLPIRFVAEALGAEVSWNEAEAKVTITKGDLVIEIYIGQPFALVNGQPVQLDEPAFIENDRTYLPLRFVAEALGATVLWDGNTNTVTIIPEK